MKSLFPVLVIFACLQLTGCVIMPQSLLFRQERPFQPNKGTAEVSLSYGEYSATELFNGNSNNYVTSSDETSNTGSIFASYHYYLSNRFAIGMTLGGQSLSYNVYGDNNNYQYLQRINLFTTGFEAKYVIGDFKYFQYYGLVGVAATYRTEDYTNVVNGPYLEIVPNTGVKFNMQVTPIGLRFGKNIGGFLELGLGYKGLFNTGVFYSFRQRSR